MSDVPVRRMTRFQWILHFTGQHKLMTGVDIPSVEEMMKYAPAFDKVKLDHDVLHARFHTGHEHDGMTGLPIEPRKRKPFVEIVDD